MVKLLINIFVLKTIYGYNIFYLKITILQKGCINAYVVLLLVVLKIVFMHTMPITPSYNYITCSHLQVSLS